MKTEVTLERSFMGSFVRQKSKTELFSATDLVKIANKKRRELDRPMFNFSAYLKLKSTKEFVEELQKENNTVIVKSRGKGSSTWVHPFLFIDIALACDPKFKVEVYRWLYDQLLKYRNDSGDSYKKMVGSLYDKHSNKQSFHKYITKVANYIKTSCNVVDWNKANENQLFLRDKMHENIALLCSVLNSTNEAVRIGVFKAMDDNKDLIS